MNHFQISIRSNVKQLQKQLGALAFKQMPYAISTAVTSLARMVQADEKKNMAEVFKSPSPFTLNAVRVLPARKGSPIATVFVMDKTAEYLEPYEDGGLHHLNSKALLNPKDIQLNQYGQLRKGTLAALKARSDIFIGPVKTKHGIINGVWQRTAKVATVTRMKNGQQTVSKTRRGLNTNGGLRLLIRFGDALPVKQRLHYRDRAQKIVDANLDRELGRALGKAIATARG